MKAVKETLQEKEPSQIVVEIEFDLTVIYTDKPQNALKRWWKSFLLYNQEGFLESPEAKSMPVFPLKDFSAEKKLEELERQAKKRS